MSRRHFHDNKNDRIGLIYSDTGSRQGAKISRLSVALNIYKNINIHLNKLFI